MMAVAPSVVAVTPAVVAPSVVTVAPSAMRAHIADGVGVSPYCLAAVGAHASDGGEKSLRATRRSSNP